MNMTTDFYNTHSAKLINRYDNASMSSLHNLLIKYIPQKSRVLDIGFGSGRDLQFLQTLDCNIWGIDPSSEFVKNAKNRFPNFKEQFFKASVPFNKEQFTLNEKFDIIMSVAMWMHLKNKQYASVVDSILSVSKITSTIIISYSEGSRVNDERYFEDVDTDYLIELFKNRGFFLVETIINGDSLNRDSLSWKTVVFKHD